jgi:copper oxidase (laccase) domain-containing protein
VGLAAQRLERAGVSSITAAGGCTVTDGHDFWSYRRDGNCGRMAGIVALQA